MWKKYLFYSWLKDFSGQNSSLKASAYSLVIANLVPLAGVLFFGWSAFRVIFLYWAENAVVGFYNVLKMILARVDKIGLSGNILIKLFMIPFFILHYGIFTLVHGIFVFAMFGQGAPFLSAITPSVIASLSALFISHGISFYANFIRREEYRKYSPGDILFQPYSRVIVMHFSIIIGGFLILLLKLPSFAIIPFIALKIIADVSAHVRQHR